MIRGGNPKITNLVLTNLGEEYSHTFGQFVKKFLIQPRNFKDIVFAFKPGETTTKFISLPSGSPYYEDYIIGPFTIYLKGLENNTIVEIIEWEAKD